MSGSGPSGFGAVPPQHLERDAGSRTAVISGRGGVAEASTTPGGRVCRKRRTMVRLAYLVLSLVPTAAVVALAWYVVRAVSVRVVWRETTDARHLDDRPAA